MRIAVLIVLAMILQPSLSIASEDVRELIKNPELISEKISKIESLRHHALDSERTSILEKLSYNLLQLKKYGTDLQLVGSLGEIISMAEKNEWSNILSAAQKIKGSCDVANGPQDECFISISDFDSIVNSRDISLQSKNILIQLSNNYSAYNEARLQMTDVFIEATGNLLARAKPIIHDLSLSSNEEIPKPENLLLQKKDSDHVVTVYKKPEPKAESAFLTTKEWGLGISILGAGLMATLVGFMYFSRKEKKKEVQAFYLSLYYALKKYKISGRLFGNVTSEKIEFFKKIEKPYLAALFSSRNFKSPVDIYIKGTKGEMIMETLIYMKKPIQEFLDYELHAQVAQNFSGLEKHVASLGGEISYVNSFNKNGELVSTGFSVRI